MSTFLDEPVVTVMRSQLYFARGEDTVAEEAQIMKRYGVGSVLVIQSQRLVGIVTERDVLYKVA